jgi:hypothetical protein
MDHQVEPAPSVIRQYPRPARPAPADIHVRRWNSVPNKSSEAAHDPWEKKMAANDLKTFLDEQAITEQIYRYCRSMDRADVPLGYSCFHEDAMVDYGAGYTGSGHGFIDWARDFHLSSVQRHSHQVTNVLIEINGDAADSEAYFTATLRMDTPSGLADMVVAGRYLDKWAKRDGRWATLHRQCIGDIANMIPVTSENPELKGARNPNDPSYALAIARVPA